MAINDKTIDKAKQLATKLQEQYNSMSEDDPEFQRTLSNLDGLRSSINEYNNTITKKNESGQLTEHAPTFASESHYFEGNGGQPNFVYEPPVDKVREILANDPETVKRLGLTNWTANLMQSGPKALESVTEDSTAYKAIADDMWQKQVEEAKKTGQPLYRYGKLSFGEDPGKVITGGLLKHIPALVLGAGRTMTMGTGESAGTRMENYIREKDPNFRSGRPDPQAIEDASPVAETIGRIGGYAGPGMGRALTNLGTQAVKFATRGPVGRTIGTGIVGGAQSAAESTVENVANTHAAGQEIDPNELEKNAIQAALFGGALGAGGNILQETAGALSGSIRNAPKNVDIKNLEDAGGRLNFGITAAKGTPEMEENIANAMKPREFRHADDFAAQKVAPQIAENVDKQVLETYKAAGEALEGYHASPEGLSPKRVTEPVNFIINYLRKGKNVGDFGTVGDAVPGIAHKLRTKLLNEAEVKNVDPEEYTRLKEQYGDDIIALDPAEADFILGRKPAQTPGQSQGQYRQPGFFPDNLSPENPFANPTVRASARGPFRATVTGTQGGGPIPDELPSGTKLLGAGMPELPSGVSELPPGQTPPQLDSFVDNAGNSIQLRQEAALDKLKDQMAWGDELMTWNRELMEPGKLARSNEANKIQNLLGQHGIMPSTSKMAVDPGQLPPSEPGKMTVLLPRARKSKEVELIQQDLAADLMGSKGEEAWLKQLDQSFRQTRDKFAPNKFTPVKETLDDGTEVTGLSALQRMHSKALKRKDEIIAGTGVTTQQGVINKVKQFKSGQNVTADQEILNEAQKLGLEGPLNQVAGTRALQNLRARGNIETSQGLFKGLIDAAGLRALPALEAVGNVPQNPFIAQPNTPSGLIQKYLFQNAARDLAAGGRAGQYGNEVSDELYPSR
jgi:hypothetical protein